MVPFIFFLSLLLSWDLLGMGRKKVGLGSPSLPFHMMTGPVQHIHSAILDAWRFSARLSERKGFLGGEFADFQHSLQLLTSSHLRERDKNVVKSHVVCVSVWNGCLLSKAKKEDVPCRFCSKRDGDGHLFWSVLVTLLLPSSMSGSWWH